MPQTLRGSLRVCYVTPLGTQDALPSVTWCRRPFLTLPAGVKAWVRGRAGMAGRTRLRPAPGAGKGWQETASTLEWIQSSRFRYNLRTGRGVALSLQGRGACPSGCFMAVGTQGEACSPPIREVFQLDRDAWLRSQPGHLQSSQLHDCFLWASVSPTGKPR